MKEAKITLTVDELEVLLWILTDWRSTMSVGNIGVNYPNNAISSTQLIRLFYDAFAPLKD